MQDWQLLAADWLAVKSARSHSAYTAKSYSCAMERWQAFLAAQNPPIALGDVDASHVRGWQRQMRARGLRENTVNHQLACVSSFYAWVMDETHLADGVESHRWADAAGKLRSNPFRADNAPRGRAHAYERARILSAEEAARMLRWLEFQAEAGTPASTRNRALIMTFLYTGWRSAELLRMRWGDLRPSRSHPGVTLYAWRGSGGRIADDVLPAPCMAAVKTFLQTTGRLGGDFGPDADEPVWLPVAEPPIAHLRHAPQPDPDRPISERSALRILRGALRGAGIRNPEGFRIHDLRHTHAHLLIQSGHSVATLQQRLHHSSLATTGLYIRTVHGQEPQDIVTRSFAQLWQRADSAQS